MSSGVRRALVAALAVAAFAGLLAVVGPSASAGLPPAPPAPTPTPARANDPANIYGIGDSITTATGTGNLGAETPANSWVTGTNPAVNSMRARLGIPAGSAVTLATNGRRMQDFDDQANQLPASAQYVVAALGGNDLCRPSVAEMTSVAEYRNQLRLGLEAVRAQAPDALIFIGSIPDIYNLWYIRGAESPYNPNPSPRRSGLNGAHFYWDNPLVDIIPCQSLVDAPTDSSAAATARRLAVRQRNLEFNQVIAEECGAVLRCRTDGGLAFELSSNRIDPYDNTEPGPAGYLPMAERWFTDDDISFNRGTLNWLCPATGIVGSGTICGDHFHPSLEGQAKLAEGGHAASYQFGDDTFPELTVAPARGPDGLGAWASAVDVHVSATDDVGVRGFEYRVHHPDGTVDPWTTQLGDSFVVPVAEQGTTHVEARAMDVNGNLTASQHTTIAIDSARFTTFSGTVLEQGSGDPLEGITIELHDAAEEGVTDTATSAADGTFTFSTVHEDRELKINLVDEDGSHLGEWAQNVHQHAQANVYGVQDSPTVRLERLHACDEGFHDVSPSHPFADDICWLVGEGITTGYEDGTFRPSIAVSRQAMSAFLHRLAGAPPVTVPTVPTFSDVGTGHPFFAEVEWAVGEGIVGGYDDGTFRGGAPVSRQAMAAFMFRMADPADWTPPTVQRFSDVGLGHPFFSQIQWLVSVRVTTGYDDGTFRPGTAVSRQAMAAFLHRLAPLLD